MARSRSRRTPKGYNSFSTFNPAQQQGFQQLIQQLMGQQTNVAQNPAFQGGQNYLQNLLSGSPEAFENFEAPFKRQFEEQTIPGLAERFSGLGSGAQQSSAFQQALGQAGAGLSENLAALRSGLQMQAVPRAQEYAQQPFQNLLSLLGLNTQGLAAKQPSFLQSFGTSLAGGLGSGLSSSGGGFMGILRKIIGF